jgi:hypothetical protein
MNTKSPGKPQTPEQIARANRQRLAAEEGVQAMAEVSKANIAVRKNMERLREMRLAKEATDALLPVPEKKPKVAKAKKSRVAATAK